MSQLTKVESAALNALISKYGTWMIVEHIYLRVSHDLRLEETTADRSTDVIDELRRDKIALEQCLIAITEEP